MLLLRKLVIQLLVSSIYEFEVYLVLNLKTFEFVPSSKSLLGILLLPFALLWRTYDIDVQLELYEM